MYEVKGRVSEDKCCHWLITEASTLAEALSGAINQGMYEVYAVHLSRIQEVIKHKDDIGKWFKANVKEEQIVLVNGKEKTKKVTSQFLVEANDFHEASGIMANHTREGYDMITCALSETSIEEVFEYSTTVE